MCPRPCLNRLYGSTAWYWDSLVHSWLYRRAYVRLFQALQTEEWLGPPGSPLRVLDCGTGTGLLAVSLADATRSPLDLWGIDTSSDMLDRARRRLARAGIRAALTRADLCALPFCQWRNGRRDDCSGFGTRSFRCAWSQRNGACGASRSNAADHRNQTACSRPAFSLGISLHAVPGEAGLAVDAGCRHTQCTVSAAHRDGRLAGEGLFRHEGRVD